MDDGLAEALDRVLCLSGNDPSKGVFSTLNFR
jgi:hypothetical protein